MKKVLRIAVFFIIIFLGVQICVHADMGIPEIRPYKVKVINPNGVICYDNDGNILVELKYGDEIEVDYETLWADISKVTFVVENIGRYETADIDLKDVASVEEMYVSDELNTEMPREKVVVDEHGAILYKGPGFAYEKTGTIIPKGTEIVVYAEKSASENPWFYTTYEGVSGWVCELECLGTYLSELIIIGDVESWERTIGSDIPEEKGIIPGEIILNNIVILDPWEQRYYFKYNDEWVTIRHYNELYSTAEIKIYKVPEDIEIHEKIMDDTNNNIVIGKIPANTEFAVRHSDMLR